MRVPPSLPTRNAKGAGLADRTTRQRFRVSGLVSEGVEYLDPGQIKVLDVAGDHGHTVHPRRRRDERVDHRERLGVLLTAPDRGDAESDGENPVLETGLDIPEPALERGSPVPVSRPRTLAIPAQSRPG